MKLRYLFATIWAPRLPLALFLLAAPVTAKDQVSYDKCRLFIAGHNLLSPFFGMGADGALQTAPGIARSQDKANRRTELFDRDLQIPDFSPRGGFLPAHQTASVTRDGRGRLISVHVDFGSTPELAKNHEAFLHRNGDPSFQLPLSADVKFAVRNGECVATLGQDEILLQPKLDGAKASRRLFDTEFCQDLHEIMAKHPAVQSCADAEVGKELSAVFARYALNENDRDRDAKFGLLPPSVTQTFFSGDVNPISRASGELALCQSTGVSLFYEAPASPKAEAGGKPPH